MCLCVCVFIFFFGREEEEDEETRVVFARHTGAGNRLPLPFDFAVYILWLCARIEKDIEWKRNPLASFATLGIDWCFRKMTDNKASAAMTSHLDAPSIQLGMHIKNTTQRSFDC